MQSKILSKRHASQHADKNLQYLPVEMMSSDEDEHGRIKKHKQPFSPTKRVTFDYSGKLVNVHDPVIPKSVNQAVNPGVKVKDYIEDGSVYSGEGRSAQTTRSGAKKKGGSPSKTSPNATTNKKMKKQVSLDAQITSKDLKLNDAFKPADAYKNMTKLYEEDLNNTYCLREA